MNFETQDFAIANTREEDILRCRTEIESGFGSISSPVAFAHFLPLSRSHDAPGLVGGGRLSLSIRFFDDGAGT